MSRSPQPSADSRVLPGADSPASEKPQPAPAAPHPDATLPATPISFLPAEELHEFLVHAHASGNVARKCFIDGLLKMSRGGYRQLGAPSFLEYVDATFRYKKSQTYEFLRVARALEHLPKLAAAFEIGELSWSLLAELTEIATSETEEEWLEFARAHRVKETSDEIECAKENGRRRPRQNANGLPRLPVRLGLKFEREDWVIFERGMEKVAAEMSAGLGGAKPEPEKVLLYLMDRVLQSEPAGDAVLGGRKERADSPYMIVFHSCPECHRARLEAPEGRVEVPPETIERVAGSARCIEIPPEEEVPPAESEAPVASEASPASARARGGRVPLRERDRPNTPKLRRAVWARAGGRCENPFCRRETSLAEGHDHHLDPRSEGGATALWNGVWCCRRCHSLLHAGVLEVKGDPATGLTWTPRAADLTRRIRAELERTRALAQAVGGGAGQDSGHPESGDPENPPRPAGLCEESAIEDAVRALTKLGCTKSSAWERVASALERLSEKETDGKPIDATRLLTEAVRGKASGGPAGAVAAGAAHSGCPES